MQERTAISPRTPTRIPRPEHNISRANISENALKVLYRLKGAGYQAFLVGGGVRDLLLGREPKDFDVATDALPEEVRRVFRNCRLIGRRFRLAHVRFGREIIEVATFRAQHDGEGNGERVLEDGMILRDNVYGTLEEDALRRDFTVNALYYDIRDFSVLDFAGGMADIAAGRLRLIGDPEVRFTEDPVRMLRAVRFAAKLGFTIDPATEVPLHHLGHLLQGVPAARLFEEVLKLFHGGTALAAFERLRQYGLFAELFPASETALAREEFDFPLTFVARSLENTDRRIAEGKPINPAFLFAALLWEPVRLRAAELETEEPPIAATQQAATEVLARQQGVVAIPKRFTLPMREIWTLQHRFEFRQGKRPLRLLGHPRFRAAYDFLVLRAEAGEADPALARWWTEFQEQDPEARAQIAEQTPKRRRPRRRRRKNRPQSDTEA